jgi:hypothetical protein
MFKISPGPMNWYIYGNVFYNQLNASASCFWNSNVGGGVNGPIYIYNNTFYEVIVTNGQGNSQQFASGSIARNNIFWFTPALHNGAASPYSGDWPSDRDYDFYSGPSGGGSHSISNGSNPFIDSAGGDFRLNVLPGNLFGFKIGTPFDRDPTGRVRLWYSCGAYEWYDPAFLGGPRNWSNYPATGGGLGPMEFDLSNRKDLDTFFGGMNAAAVIEMLNDSCEPGSVITDGDSVRIGLTPGNLNVLFGGLNWLPVSERVNELETHIETPIIA